MSPSRATLDSAGRDLRSLFDPASIAVVGASNDEKKWGHWIAKGALRGEHRRSVHLVNRRAVPVLGHDTVRRLADIPGGCELAVICVPAEQFARAVDDALACGAKAVIGISAGLGETGTEGQLHQDAVAGRVRQHGAVLLGPNCLGTLDQRSELFLISNDLPDGPVGLISQSGNVAIELGIKAATAGTGFGRFASLGNQADVSAADLVADFAAAPHLKAIALYCEDFGDGRRFLEAAEAAVGAGKPVLVLAVGASAASARAARSHTGSLVSGRRAIAAACRAAGIDQVSTPGELVDLLAGLGSRPAPRGRRVGVLADGGGHGAVAADVLSAAGLVVPALSPALTARLAADTGTSGSTANPIDLAGAGEQDVWSFARVLGSLLDSPEIDAVLLTGYFGDYGRYSAELERAETKVADAIVELSFRSEKPVVVHTMHEEAGYGEALGRLRSGGIPLLTRVEEAAHLLARLCERSEAVPHGLPSRPTPEPSVGEGGYFSARRLLAEAGVSFAAARAAADLAGVLAAGAEIGYPVVLKAAGLEHKSDADGVVLAIGDAAALEEAAVAMWSRLGPMTLSVEEMVAADGGIELIVGARTDARFGPIALVGLGGIYAEVLDDVATSLAPVTVDAAEEMIRSLRGAALLSGARGRPPLDIRAAATALAALSQVAGRHPEVTELEVNPLLVTAAGARGLDARVVTSQPGPAGGSTGGGSSA